MSVTRQILCEGYHDRAFWYGLLEQHGCKFAKEHSLPGHQKSPGEYVGQTPDGGMVSIVPVDGVPNLLPAVETRLLQRKVRPIQHLIVNRDADTEAGEVGGMQPARLLQLAEQHKITVQLDEHGDVIVEDAAMKLSLVRWESEGETPEAVPSQQTLERIVCMAIYRAYPERSAEVSAWLRSRTKPPSYDLKEVAWSYMAGWFADSGCDDFYRSLWREKRISVELERILRLNGTWRVVESLTNAEV